jgi:hypothetical protein
MLYFGLPFLSLDNQVCCDWYIQFSIKMYRNFSQRGHVHEKKVTVQQVFYLNFHVPQMRLQIQKYRFLHRHLS